MDRRRGRRRAVTWIALLLQLALAVARLTGVDARDRGSVYVVLASQDLVLTSPGDCPCIYSLIVTTEYGMVSIWLTSAEGYARSPPEGLSNATMETSLLGQARPSPARPHARTPARR
eukprot:tig00020563_g11334.t1